MPAPLYSLKGKRVFVAGHRGMVGLALMRRLGQTKEALDFYQKSLQIDQHRADAGSRR
jgi:nucleoside-diphosphate-sugar epimerase